MSHWQCEASGYCWGPSVITPQDPVTTCLVRLQAIPPPDHLPNPTTATVATATTTACAHMVPRRGRCGGFKSGEEQKAQVVDRVCHHHWVMDTDDTLPRP